MLFPTEMNDRRRCNSRIFIWKFILFLSVLPNAIDGAGRVDINIFTLSNKCGRLADGSVCKNSALKSNDSASCPGLCNVIAEVCLQPFKDNVVGYRPDTSWCPYGNGSSSGVVYGSNSFDMDKGDNRGLISIPFTFSWIGSVTLILEIKHRDITIGKDYLIARSVKPLNVSASKSLTFTNLQEFYKIATVDEEIHFVYGYRIVCNPFDYGDQCSKSCMPRDDENGHYRCDEDGNRVCLDGYKGEDRMCVDAVCSADCKGTCRTPGACDKCPFGWNGPRCDQCIRYTGCVHGYCNKPHECLCEPRWGGLQCDIDMDYCYHKMPCRNGATCIPHAPNNYTCICESGFAGKDCEIELNPCWSNPCLNFGTCVLTSRNRFQCLCDQLHSGQRCEKLLAGKSNTDPCFYDGEVFNHDSHWGTTDCRKCHCIDGFANCSQPMCNSGDCLSAGYPYGSMSSRCPANQVCRSVNPDLWTCLKWPCSQEKFGQCVSIDLIENSGAANRQKCEPTKNEIVGYTKSSLNRVEDDLEFCSRFYVKLRQDAIPVGAYPEHICFHILLLLLKQQMTQYNVFCTLDRPNLTLAVDVVSTKEKWTVNGLKLYLMDLLKLNSSGNPYLRSISYVYDDSSSSSTSMSTNYVNDKFEQNFPHGQNLNWLLIYILPAVVVITIILLVIVIILKRRRSSVMTEENDKNIKTGMKNNECEMQWNNLSVSCASIFTNSMCKSNVNDKKQCNLYKNLSTENHILHDKWTIIGDKCQSSSSIDDVSANKKDIYVMEATV